MENNISPEIKVRLDGIPPLERAKIMNSADAKTDETVFLKKQYVEKIRLLMNESFRPVVERKNAEELLMHIMAFSSALCQVAVACLFTGVKYGLLLPKNAKEILFHMTIENFEFLQKELGERGEGF